MSNKSTVQADDGSLSKAEKTQRKLKRIFLSKRSHCERLHTLQLPLLSQKDKATEKVKESSGCWQVGRGKEKSQRAGPWKHSVWCHIGGMCSRYKFVRVYNRKSEHWCESQALVRAQVSSGCRWQQKWRDVESGYAGRHREKPLYVSANFLWTWDCSKSALNLKKKAHFK